jgi:hypothetical protein
MMTILVEMTKFVIVMSQYCFQGGMSEEVRTEAEWALYLSQHLPFLSTQYRTVSWGPNAFPSTPRTLPPEPTGSMRRFELLEGKEKLRNAARLSQKAQTARPVPVPGVTIHNTSGSGNVVVKDQGRYVNDFRPSLEKVKQKAKKFDVPPKLMEDFLKGKKTAVTVIEEYCQICKIDIAFVGAVVMPDNQKKGNFGIVCLTDGFLNRKGVACTKKDAKERAAKCALNDLTMTSELPHNDLTDDDGTETPKLRCLSKTQIGGEGATTAAQHQTQQEDWDDLDSESSCSSLESSYSSPTDSVPPGSEPGMEAEQTVIDDLFEIWDSHINMLLGFVRLPTNNISKNFCGFIVQRPGCAPQVVAVGSGSHHVINSDDRKGQIVRDCHGIVIARRAFQRYMYSQFKRSCSQVFWEREASIFVSGPAPAKLKKDVQIHVMMAQAPCGDCLHSVTMTGMFVDGPLSENDWTLINSGYHEPREDSLGQIYWKKAGLTRTLAQEVLHASCTDKLLRWNVLGLEGCLLGVFVDPVYPTSINFASKYRHGDIVRGLCCRAEAELDKAGLPDGFSLNHPLVGRSTLAKPLPHDETRYLSLNWTLSDEAVELIDPRTGEVSPLSPALLPQAPKISRISKAVFHVRFRRLTEMNRDIDMRNIETYSDCKRFAKQSIGHYGIARACFERMLVDGRLGQWPHSQEKRDRENFKALS